MPSTWKLSVVEADASAREGIPDDNLSIADLSSW